MQGTVASSKAGDACLRPRPITLDLWGNTQPQRKCPKKSYQKNNQIASTPFDRLAETASINIPWGKKRPSRNLFYNTPPKARADLSDTSCVSPRLIRWGDLTEIFLYRTI